MCEDHKSVKKTVKLSIFFVLLGSACVKAARKMLLKLTPGVGQTYDKIRDKCSLYLLYISLWTKALRYKLFFLETLTKRLWKLTIKTKRLS